MDFYIVIPAHNEAKYIEQTLLSLLNQRFLPKKIVVVDDNSTDETAEIVKGIQAKSALVEIIQTYSKEDRHLPGAKVVRAFYRGLDYLDDKYDVICKFDADLIFPVDYLETIAQAFKTYPKVGMAGGLCYIKNSAGAWEYERIAGKEHLRGPVKAYRKECFEAIGGIRETVGWDTLDQLLSGYKGWEVKIFEDLRIKHLRPTHSGYANRVTTAPGRVFYQLRYGLLISVLASAKAAWNQKKGKVFYLYMKGYFQARKKGNSFLVTEDEGKWIRKYRLRKIRKKIPGFTSSNCF